MLRPSSRGGVPGLKAADRQPDFLEALGQRDRRRVAEAAGPVVRQADMDQAIEEGAGGQHHGGRLEADAELRHHPADPVTAEDQVVRRLLKQRQVVLVFEAAADRLLVELPVGLGAGGPYRRALGGIQDAELDARLVGRRRHRTTQGIDLLDQMALADAADRGIAGHRTEGFDVVREQQRARTGTRRSEGGFGAGMAAADHDHIKGRGKLHWLRSSEKPVCGISGRYARTRLRNQKRRNHTPLDSKTQLPDSVVTSPRGNCFHVKLRFRLRSPRFT
jgi:hypothetical protein